MQRIKEVAAAPSTAAPAPHTATASPTPAAAATAASPKDVRPVKTSKTQPTLFDVMLVKKKLFSIPSSHQVPPSIPDAGKRNSYQMKEDDLWTNLFV